MSHTLANLEKNVLEKDQARECAQRVVLIHVGSGEAKALSNIFGLSRLAVEHSSRKKSVLRFERMARIPPSVYFFAGRPFPRQDLGIVVYVLAQQQVIDKLGTCTPFDTGGVLDSNARSLLPWRANGAAKYVQDHCEPMTNFTRYISLFLSEFFDSVEDYWSSPPARQIDGVSLCSGKRLAGLGF